MTGKGEGGGGLTMGQGASDCSDEISLANFKMHKIYLEGAWLSTVHVVELWWMTMSFNEDTRQTKIQNNANYS